MMKDLLRKLVLCVCVLVLGMTMTASVQAATVSIPVSQINAMSSALAGSNYNNINCAPIGGNADVYRALTAFDLSAIPADQTVTSATLRLAFFAFTGSNTTTISIRPTTESWTSGATWNTKDGTNAWAAAGGGVLGGVVSSLTSGFSGSNNSRVDFSFTGLATTVQGWLDTPATNNGFLIRNNVENDDTLDKYMYQNWQVTDDIGFGGGFTAFPILDVTYVPEPATIALLSLGGLLIRRKR